MPRYTVTITYPYDCDQTLPSNVDVEAISRDEALALLCSGFDDMPTPYAVVTVRTIKAGRVVVWRRAPRMGWRQWGIGSLESSQPS